MAKNVERSESSVFQLNMFNTAVHCVANANFVKELHAVLADTNLTKEFQDLIDFRDNLAELLKPTGERKYKQVDGQKVDRFRNCLRWIVDVNVAQGLDRILADREELSSPLYTFRQKLAQRLDRHEDRADEAA